MIKILILMATIINCCVLNAQIIQNTDLSETSTYHSHQGKIIASALWETLGHKENLIEQEIINPKREQVVKKEVNIKPTPVIQSQGQAYIEQIKAKNRAKLKQMAKEEKNNPPAENLKDEYLQSLSKLKKKNKQTIKKWKSQNKETYKRWKQKRIEFLKELKYIKKTHFSFSSPPLNLPASKLNQPIVHIPKEKYHIIPRSLGIPVRNQKRRPTCSAFAGVRAMEVLLNGVGKYIDISEQYFYWSSKPNCQRSPCTKKGSWVTEGFDFSLNSNSPDIPREKDCPYNPSAVKGNEAQTPLKGKCKAGIIKTLKYKSLPLMDDIVNALKKNTPVIAGVKLTPSFYKNKGLITLENAFRGPKMDSHSAGHAILLVGYMELPTKMHSKEGRICFISVNSWGEGWGRGGHSCISEKWLLQQRVPQAIVGVSKIELRI